MTTAAATNHSLTLTQRCAVLAADIKVSHSIFALPWAILATFLAADAGRPHWGQVALIVGCMVFARTCAMCANRLLDARLDALNPRTARRAIPAGTLSASFVTAALVVSALLFIACTSGFGLAYRNWVPLMASVPVLAFVCAYPLLKRFSRLCHYYLGAALALAPICAWVAIAGSLSVEPILMAGAVLLWTAGFDIIYACQDYASDVETGVRSVPSTLGVAGALWVARVTHIASITLLATLGWVSPELSKLYFVGVGITAVLLTIEHAVVRPTDLSRVNLAFFTLNGIIAVVVGALGVIDTQR